MTYSIDDTWMLPESVSCETLLAALGETFTLSEGPEYEATVIYADTFDWRLYRQDCLLHRHGASWTLYHGEGGEVTVQQGGPEHPLPCFAADFPAGRLRETLEPILGIRCLLPVATLHLEGRQVRLLNEDEKTVVRLVCETQRPLGGLGDAGTTQPSSGEALPFPLIRVFPVRGYDKELARVQEILSENGVSRDVSPLIGFEAGCRLMGREPLDYSSKLRLQLDRDQSAGQVMTTIHLELFATMRRNLPGVIADWDIEFLHDFRVAVRRVRSGLSLVGKVFPGSMTARFKKDMASLGRLTGTTRDLDVYLLERAAYFDRLAPALVPGLTPFFDDLARQRAAAQRELVRALKGKKVQSILTHWEKVLRRDDAPTGPWADRPVLDVAGRVIWRRYDKVVRAGQSIQATTPDVEVHALRIECKKLRYAMEFFASLYPEEAMRTLTRHLKKLQDILGVFNDLYVQQTMLHQAVRTQRAASPESAAALGGLMQSLFQEQEELRLHFGEAFAEFSDPEATELFQQLFSPRKEPA